jgi:hypothetical protein
MANKKLLQATISLVFIFVSFQNSFSQKKPSSILVADFGKICSEELMAHFDTFMNAIYDDPNSTGYIIFYGDKSVEGRNLNFIRYLTLFYPLIRRFDKSRLVLLRGENQNQMKVQFWVVPAGAPTPELNREFVQDKITSAILFDENWADFNKWSGKLDIYANGFLELGCEFSPNVRDFAKTLLSNPELMGYLIVYTKFGKGAKRGNQIANFALRDLTRNHKVPLNRLKAIYGGNRKEPEIELWFVPKGGLPPKPTPDKKS